MAAVESNLGCSGLHCSVLVEFTDFFQYQPTKVGNHFENKEQFQNQQVSQKTEFRFSSFGSNILLQRFCQSIYFDTRNALPL